MPVVEWHDSNKVQRRVRACGSAFLGFSEDAPLDLFNVAEGVERALVDHTFEAFADTAAGVGYCAHPVRLVGHTETINPHTGEVLSAFSSADAPLGVLYRLCGSRRLDVCPVCSRVYARDTFAMVKSGITGGKTIPESVAGIRCCLPRCPAVRARPRPPTQDRAEDGRPVPPRDKAKLGERGLPVGCMTVHDDQDPVNGAPLCEDCYQWDSAIVWQWWAPELWRRTTTSIRRAVAARLGLAERHLRQVARLEFAKVAEYQDRGLVHFHCLIRLDGPDGPGSPAPLDGPELAKIIGDAIAGMRIEVPAVDDQDQSRVLV